MSKCLGTNGFVVKRVNCNNGGWSGGAKVLGKLSVPGHPTNLDNSRVVFLSSIISFFFLPLSGRWPDID